MPIRNRKTFKNTYTNVTSADFTDVSDAIECRDANSNPLKTLAVTVDNNDSGSDALAGFKMQGKMHTDDAWFDVLVDDDWASDTIDILRFCTSTSPKTLAKGSEASAIIDVSGFYLVKFLAKGAGNISSLVCRGYLC